MANNNQENSRNSAPVTQAGSSETPRVRIPEGAEKIGDSDAFKITHQGPVESIDGKWDFYRTPCFRSSMMFGIGGGAVLGILKYLRSKDIKKSNSMAVNSFFVTSLAAWAACRYNQYQRRKAVDNMLSAQGIKRLPSPKEREALLAAKKKRDEEKANASNNKIE